MTSPPQNDTTVSREVVRGTPRGARKAAVVSVVFPTEIAVTIPLRRERVVLGREPDGGGPAIEHPTVSRRHFAIEWDEAADAHVGSDLDSHNGSAIDGTPASGGPRILTDGALLRLGDVLLVYEVDRAVRDAPEVSRENIPGQSVATRSLRAAVARAASDPSPVLLIGETGTGKESIASELHRLSPCASGPFLAVNCAALAPTLIESQLFGHVKGAFTGATAAHPGLFRSASGGSLFLDEIGELAPELQPKLLRVIQEGEVQPVGGIATSKVDVRVISASNRDLAELARSGGFRRDLYARLSLWEIRVPTLAARRADILTWFSRLDERWQARRNSPGRAPSPVRLRADAAELLLLHRFPMNLRELDRLVHVLAGLEERPIGIEHMRELLVVPAGAAPAPAPAAAPRRRSPAPTKAELEQALGEARGNVRAVARRFGRDRRQIYRWLETFGLARPRG